MARGDRPEEIFRDDRGKFLGYLAEGAERYRVKVHCYVLLEVSRYLLHVFGCLIKADFITFSIDNLVIWTAATPPEATQPLSVLCNFVAAKTPADPGAITTEAISCYLPPSSLTSPSPTS
jgi:hypothetical protein